MTTSSTEPDFNEIVRMALTEAHAEFLRSLVRRTASQEEAEDILQDFYLKIVQNAQTIRNPGSLRGWLAQVLRHTLADYYRVSDRKQLCNDQQGHSSDD